MADIKTSAERSKNMSRIRSADTKPEVWLRKQLFMRGYRYRKNVKDILGHPDIWLARYNSAIFVHGCFWHRHKGCKFAYLPKSREDFWKKKFEDNIARDLFVKEQLISKGIKVIVIWECTIKKMIKSDLLREKAIDEIELYLRNNELMLEL